MTCNPPVSYKRGVTNLRVVVLRGTTDKNLDRLAEFLNHELAQPALAAQIPSGAHVFHGSHNDVNLTRANLRLATDILLSMTLGHLEEAPMIMVFEYEPGGRVLVDLTTEARKKRARKFVETFREQSQQEMIVEVNGVMAA